MLHLINELVAFTGLPKATVEAMAIHRDPKWPDHCKEWTLWNPKTTAEIQWFYRASRTYLFVNARHKTPTVLLHRIQRGSKVLDFGGGAGNMSFALAEQLKCDVDYYDLNELQKAFVRYVADKHGLHIRVLEDTKNPVAAPEAWRDPHPMYDAVIALDVFEHIPDYPVRLKQIAGSMKDGAELFVVAPFGKDEPSHFEDAHGFEKVCEDNNLTLQATHGQVKIYLRRI